MIADVDSKHCPDCDFKLFKKIIKWPEVFEAYWCRRCKMDFFIDQVKIIPRKSIFLGYDEKGKPQFRVVRLFTQIDK